MLVGPRAVGKTTTGLRRAKSVIRLDRPAEAGAFLADPDAALRGHEEPLLLDEWQEVPGALGAVKRAVDRDPRPGRFLITGSVRSDLVGDSWPGTGRITRIALLPMAVRERLGRDLRDSFFDRAEAGAAFEVPSDPPDLRGYVELALTGGFPPAMDLDDRNRARWLESYVDQLVTRDAASFTTHRDPTRLRRYLDAYALSAAGIATERTLLEASGLDNKTARSYERLLSDLFVVQGIPAWASNRLQRLIRAPKREMVDSSLAAAILRVDVDTVMRDIDLLGRLLETFVLQQLRAELEMARCRPKLFHLRDHEGRHEVDLLAELSSQRVIAIEIKATSSPGPSDARHLSWLADKLGDRFTSGVLLHTGPAAYSLGSGIHALPIATLWA